MEHFGFPDSSNISRFLLPYITNHNSFKSTWLETGYYKSIALSNYKIALRKKTHGSVSFSQALASSSRVFLQQMDAIC